MLDHAFLDVLAAWRRAFDEALLMQDHGGETLSLDLAKGDYQWQGSCHLPGEGHPPRADADVTLVWTPWAQASFREWQNGDTPDDLPEVDVLVALRLHRLSEPPDVEVVMGALPLVGPSLGDAPLERSEVTVTQVRSAIGPGHVDAEAFYEGVWRFEDGAMEDRATLTVQAATAAAWVASALVRLADLPLAFLPPDPDEEHQHP